MKKALIVSGGLFALVLLVGFGGPALFPGAALSVAVRVERGLSHVERKQVSIQGLTMPYLEGGPKNGPVLLLLHGFAADKDNWTRFSSTFISGLAVVLVAGATVAGAVAVTAGLTASTGLAGEAAGAWAKAAVPKAAAMASAMMFLSMIISEC